jgi:hypothetical protein
VREVGEVAAEGVDWKVLEGHKLRFARTLLKRKPRDAVKVRERLKRTQIHLLVAVTVQMRGGPGPHETDLDASLGCRIESHLPALKALELHR